MQSTDNQSYEAAQLRWFSLQNPTDYRTQDNEKLHFDLFRNSYVFHVQKQGNTVLQTTVNIT